MDPTTIGAVILLALGLLGADAVIHPGNFSVAFEVAANLEKDGFSKGAAEAVFMEEVYRVAATKSLTAAPTINPERNKSIAVVFAETVKVAELVTALQAKFGYEPGQMSVTVFSEGKVTKVLITGDNKHSGVFQEVIVQSENESLVELIRRTADVGVSNIDPYLTALYLVQKHADDKNFKDPTALISYTKSALPPVPISPDRARMDNLLGIVQLFQDDVKSARAAFEAAIKSDPRGSVAIINAAFADVQLGDYQAASDRMERMLSDAPPANEVLLMTSYMTWAAARSGLSDMPGADDLLAKAARAYPYSGAVFDLWANVKNRMGDSESAGQLRGKAHQNAAGFENYAEVASLYFQLAERDSAHVARSKFSNPVVVSFH
jgi:tetratricopeptide (TPR) repeat protein